MYSNPSTLIALEESDCGIQRDKDISAKELSVLTNPSQQFNTTMAPPRSKSHFGLTMTGFLIILKE